MTGAVLTTAWNVAFTGILVIAVTCIYFLYLRKQNTAYILLGVMFGAYLADNTIVFCTELIPQFAVAYDSMFVTSPSFKTIYFILLMGCIIGGFSGHVIPKLTLPAQILILGFYAAILICAPMISQNNWMVFFYYLPTQLLLMGISIWGLVALKKKPIDQQMFSHADVRRILTFLLCMSIAVLIEDTLVIFLVDNYRGYGVKIHNRNLCENILFLGLAGHMIYHALENIRPVLSSAAEGAFKSGKPGSDPFRSFVMKHSLTEREQEVLQRLLEGKSQQEISDELIIALGTVKTHIHNIYQKTEAANRNQMIAKYQNYCHHLENDPTAAEQLPS